MGLLNRLFGKQTQQPIVVLDLVEIPEGPFLMGTREEDVPELMERFQGDRKWFVDEIPLHQVMLPRYQIGRTPVTLAQYKIFLEASGYTWKGAGEEQGGDDHPVVYVSHFDAQAYCKWLNDLWHASGQISSGERVLLPSEAEWEKAARGSDVRIYPWGDEPPDGQRCACYPNVTTTTPVGAYSPQGDSPYGCADMAGNVFEWTRSSYGMGGCDFKYPYNPDDGREDPTIVETVKRVTRGGSFRNSIILLRVTERDPRFPTLSDPYMGFRVVVSSASLASLPRKAT